MQNSRYKSGNTSSNYNQVSFPKALQKKRKKVINNCQIPFYRFSNDALGTKNKVKDPILAWEKFKKWGPHTFLELQSKMIVALGKMLPDYRVLPSWHLFLIASLLHLKMITPLGKMVQGYGDGVILAPFSLKCSLTLSTFFLFFTELS